MAGSIEVEFDDGAVLEVLTRISESAREPGPLMRIIGQYGVESTRQRFFDEAGPDGQHWAELNPAYAELKGAGYNILFKSGALMNSLNYRAGAHEVSWGSPMIYAAIHQFGGKIVPKSAPALEFLLGNIGARGLVPVFLVRVKSVTIPARPYLGLNTADRTEIEALATDYLRTLL